MCVSIAEYFSDDALPLLEWESLPLHLKARMRQVVHSEVEVCNYLQVTQEKAIKFIGYQGSSHFSKGPCNKYFSVFSP